MNEIPIVKLLGGIADGAETLSTHGCAWEDGEFYCHVANGGYEKNELVHAKTWLLKNTNGNAQKIKSDRRKADLHMKKIFKNAKKGIAPLVMSRPKGMTPAQYQVHYAMIRSGAEL